MTNDSLRNGGPNMSTPRPHAQPASKDSALTDATRAYLASHRKPLRDRALAGEGGTALASLGARVYDGLLSTYFCAAQARHPIREPMALFAVGGYGRGLLAHGSDLDLLLLAENPQDPALEAFVDQLLYPLWDVGLSVGHSVRSPSELQQLAREDLRTATTILDARLIAGTESYAREMIERGWRALFDQSVDHFLDDLEHERTERHQRYGASVYLLEPDVKHGRGALRDLDIVCWALGARYRTTTLKDALLRGFLRQTEAQRLTEAQEFFWRTRCTMHARSNRRADRLTFDEQEECARAMGLLDPELDPDAALARGAEKLMQSYYGHARTVATTLDLVLERCRSARGSQERVVRSERVADGIDRYDGALVFAESAGLKKDPTVALRIVLEALEQKTPLSSGARETISACTSDAEWCAQLRACTNAGALFLQLISYSPSAQLRQRGSAVTSAEQPGGSVLAELHDLGLLLAMIPEFSPVTGRVHHDVYHVYTVDVHSVAAVDRLNEMARGEHAAQFNVAACVLAELELRPILSLATLLHDVGKGRRGDHSVLGAQIGEDICNRFGLQPEHTEQVCWLIRQHLALYHFATRRDLSDPSTLEQVIALVQTPWRLRALYLLTVADLSTTSPTSMTSWKARMLDDLLRRTEELLAGDAHANEIEQRKQSIFAIAESDRDRVERFVARMPLRYLQATPNDAIVRHARATELGDHRAHPFVHIAPLSVANANSTGVALAANGASVSSAELYELIIIANDQPGLLARLAGMLANCRLDVQSAQLYSRNNAAQGSEAFDVFTVRRMDEDPGGLVRLAARLPRELQRACDSVELTVPPTQESSRFRKPEPSVKTDVVIDNDASGKFTIVEVFGRDRPGLLHAIATVLFHRGLTIALAKINTEGRRAADVFYVTDVDGAKLDVPECEALKMQLRALFDSPAEPSVAAR
jgi:[protein-PII] uridylyltransferase